MKEQFPRLFYLSQNKNEKVGSIGEWKGGVWVWRWRRNLFDRELIILNKLSDLLNRYTLKQNVDDSWQWSRAQMGFTL